MKRRFLIFLFLIILPAAVQAEKYERKQIVFLNVLAKIQIETSYSKPRAFREIQRGFDLIRELENKFSSYKENSEINRINGAEKPSSNISVSKDMAAVIRLGKTITQETKGYFDITYEMHKSGIDDIRIHEETIDLLSADLKINPTGLVKGYVVDQIIKKFKKNPKIKSATVAIGGDIGHFDRRKNDKKEKYKKSSFHALKEIPHS